MIRTPREELHHKIRNEFVSLITKYYQTNPERLKDPDIDANMKIFLKLLEDILNCVDLFEIRRKEPANGQ